MTWLYALKNGWTWAGICLLGCLFLLWRLESAENAAAMLKLEQAEQAQAHAAAVAELEKKLALEYNQSIEELLKEQKDTNDAQNKLIADLRSGVARLHPRFQCQTPAVSSTPASPGSGDGAGGGGLSEQDAEFLIRIAAEADRRVSQLQACQNVLKDNYEILRGQE